MVLLRHAARAEDREATELTEINETGRKAAALLGAAMCAVLRPADAVVLAHSPLLRCQQTAREIGAALRSHVAHCEDLGSRLFLGRWYLLNSVQALRTARRFGPQFVREWRDGGIPAEWIIPFADTARGQVEGAVKELRHRSHPRLAVLVSHDWNVLAVRDHFFGKRYEEAGWIDYLEGVVISNNGDIKLFYQTAAVPFD